MIKELLTIEFRYNDVPKFEHDCGCIIKTITIGIFDTLEEAVNEGNKILSILSNHFEVRADDKFKLKGLFGLPERLVSNTCYTTKNIQYFAKINTLLFNDLNETIDEIFKASDRYTQFKQEENNGLY